MSVFSARRHATHRESLWRFIALLAVLIAYFVYMSWQFDPATGALLAVLSWSFFVLCTPIADGGFLIAFPVRLLFGIRMMITQVIVWIAAILINVAVLLVAPEVYDHTKLTVLLKIILTTPWPDWSILLISAAGTGLSIYFGDEMMDITSHADRRKSHRHGFTYKTLLVLGLAVLTITAYYRLLSDLHMTIPAAG